MRRRVVERFKCGHVYFPLGRVFLGDIGDAELLLRILKLLVDQLILQPIRNVANALRFDSNGGRNFGSRWLLSADFAEHLNLFATGSHFTPRAALFCCFPLILGVHGYSWTTSHIRVRDTRLCNHVAALAMSLWSLILDFDTVPHDAVEC